MMTNMNLASALRAFRRIEQWEPQPGATYVRLARPILPHRYLIRPDDIVPLEPDRIFTFHRSEWALMVLSGLWAAIKALGWRVWEEATPRRAEGERDHMLLIASMFARGILPDVYATSTMAQERRAFEAMRRLSEAAALWRAQEGIRTPVNVFPDGSATFQDTAPPPSRPLLDQPAHQYIGLYVEQTHTDTLLDLAEHGEEATFKDLARTLGVEPDRLDDLWTGAVERIQHRHRRKESP